MGLEWKAGCEAAEAAREKEEKKGKLHILLFGDPEEVL